MGDYPSSREWLEHLFMEEDDVCPGCGEGIRQHRVRYDAFGNRYVECPGDGHVNQVTGTVHGSTIQAGCIGGGVSFRGR